MARRAVVAPRRPRRAAATAAVALLGAAALASCALLPGPERSQAPSVPTGGTAPDSSPATGADVARPGVETEPLPAGDGDIADDSAIWVDPTDPARSVVIADSKDDDHGGIAVYDLHGRVVQFRRDGSIGNVDLRSGFPLGGRDAVLVGANNRSASTLVFWELDPATRRLTPVHAGSLPTMRPNYGFCLYRSAASGRFYAFVSEEDGGELRQYELSGASGKVDAREVRRFDVGSQSEGCVADDDTDTLYVAEEAVAVWKYRAEPDAGAARTAVDHVGQGRLEPDIEGLALAYGPRGTGYLIVSSQGSSSFAVYDRGADSRFVKTFTVEGSGAVDGAEETDGLDVTTANAGPGFEGGLLVVHDAENAGDDTSNHKLVPLDQVLSTGQ